MRSSTWLVAVGAALAVMAGQAALAQATQNSQQQKMTSCNADAKAKGLTGDDRKSFMKTCLSDKGAAAAPAAKGNSQQEKMKTCNADAKAKGLTGDDRKAFMKSCLSGSGGAG
jgi:psiF repeat